MSDYGLMSLAPTREQTFPDPIPDSPGLPKSVRDEVVVAPFNDTDAAVQYIRAHADELAAVIVEPFQRLHPPSSGFLEALRELTVAKGVLLIFYELRRAPWREREFRFVEISWVTA